MNRSEYLQATFLSLVVIACLSSISSSILSETRVGIHQTAAIADSLASSWRFDEGTGLSAADSGGSGNTGTLVNGPVWVAGKTGTALSFDGTNDMVTTASDPIGTGPVSISVWIYPRSLGQVTSSIVNNGSTVMSFGFNNRISVCSGGASCPTSANFAASFNQWTHVVVTRDASGVMNFYINGSLSGAANQNSGTPLAATGNFRIGNTQNGAHTFDGIIDELKIYNGVLTPAEISSLYTSENSGTSSQPPATDPGTTTPPPTNNPPPVTNNPPPVVSVTPVNGVYTVPTQFATIQACADVVKAGETCRVQAGTYDEKVVPKNSGSAGNMITFEAVGNVKMRGFYLNNKSYIKVTGFEITNLGLTPDPSFAGINFEFSHFNQIINNTLHDGMRECIRMRDLVLGSESNNNIIRGNTLYKCGSQNTVTPGGGIMIFGNNNLVENNDISHLGEDFTRMTGGLRNVIRNNIFHDNSLTDWTGANGTHIDGVQNWSSTGVPVTSHELLIENNQQYNTPSHDTHFVIFQNYAFVPNDHFVVRYNNVYNLGDYVLINNVNTKGVMLYHNSFSDTSIAGVRPWNSVDWTKSSTNGKLINNIFNNSVRDGGFVYGLDATSQPFDAHNNLAYNPGTPNFFRIPIKDEIGAVIGKDPLFVGPTNLALQSSSPAIDKGGSLAKVAANDSGAGTNLVLDDVSPFQDGWAGVEPDWISVGTPGNFAQISSINYSTNTITLKSPISRSVGSSVWLFKDSNGRQVLYGSAPDIGAFEYNNGTPTAEVPVPVVGDFNKDGFVNSLDLSLLSGAWNQNNAAYDLNKDGMVNTLDFTLMVKNWTS